MNPEGPILLIDDDADDVEMFRDIIAEASPEHELISFSNSDELLGYLNGNKAVKPFLIISDIHLPKLSGLELWEKVHNNEELRSRCIPYLFFTTSVAQKDVIAAYSKSVQGFFIKPSNPSEMRTLVKAIITYWSLCTAPNYIA